MIAAPAVVFGVSLILTTLSSGRYTGTSVPVREMVMPFFFTGGIFTPALSNRNEGNQDVNPSPTGTRGRVRWDRLQEKEAPPYKCNYVVVLLKCPACARLFQLTIIVAARYVKRVAAENRIWLARSRRRSCAELALLDFARARMIVRVRFANGA